MQNKLRLYFYICPSLLPYQRVKLLIHFCTTEDSGLSFYIDQVTTSFVKTGNWKEKTQICISDVKGDRNSVIDCGWNQPNAHASMCLAPWLATAHGSGGCHEMMENLGLLSWKSQGTTLKSVGNEALIILLLTK